MKIDIASDEIIILKSEYKELMRRSLKLEALESAGVDNWDWYDYAMESYRGIFEDEIE